jgi:Family of unknown function (DUF6361)
MNSTFTWLDYSEQDRRQMLAVIDRFREKESRDELGFNVIAFAFSDMFFPGTSTIQTRARYFLFIPWLYKILEEQRVRPEDVPRRLRQLEVRLIYAVLNSEDDRGLIGRQARENLQRFPSNIYWQGLREWKIFQYPGSQDQYYASLGTYYDKLRQSREKTDDGELLHERIINAWHPSLPDAAEDFLDESSFTMTFDEADFLRERIQASNPGTLLAFLVGLDHSRGVAFPWQHPAYADFPDRIKLQLHHARAFSEASFGATLLYNFMLAEASMPGTPDAQELEDLAYSDLLEEWTILVEGSDALASWNRDEFWQIVSSRGARVSTPTRIFVDAWCDLILAPGGASDVASNTWARTLIKNREMARKRAQARLSNPRALELWSGASGVFRHAYRWASARRVLSDIAEGLARGRNDA